MPRLALQAVGPDSEATITPLVRDYFAHDGLVYSEAVERAISELFQSPTLGRMFLARVGAATVGYGALTYGFDHEAGGRIGVITDLYLVPDARGQGLGRELLDGLLAFASAQELRRVELWVLNGNGRARALYVSRGFKPVEGRRSMAFELES